MLCHDFSIFSIWFSFFFTSYCGVDLFCVLSVLCIFRVLLVSFYTAIHLRCHRYWKKVQKRSIVGISVAFLIFQLREDFSIKKSKKKTLKLTDRGGKSFGMTVDLFLNFRNQSTTTSSLCPNCREMAFADMWNAGRRSFSFKTRRHRNISFQCDAPSFPNRRCPAETTGCKKKKNREFVSAFPLRVR